MHTGQTSGALSATSTWPQFRQNHMTFSPFLKTSPFFRFSSSFKYRSSWVFSILATPSNWAAKAKKPGLRVIGVQTAACPAMAASLRDGVCYEEYPIGESVCDALVGGVGRIGYEMASQCIDQVLVLEEEEIKAAAASLIGEEKVLAECAGAVGAAAVRHSPELFQGHQTAVVISGGNIDPGLVRSLLADYL